MASSPEHPQVHIKHTTGFSTEHRQVHIEHRDLQADVDEAIADLILACWRQGIQTVNSCQQGVDDRAWIEFLSSVDAEHFLQKVIPDHDDPLYDQATWMFVSTDADEVETQYWQWSISVEDLSWVSNNDDELEHHGPPQFNLTPSVRFPPERISELVRRLSG